MQWEADYQLQLAAVTIAGVAVALTLAVSAAQVVGPLYVWGGTVCNETHGVMVCSSYLPAGLLVSVAVAAVAVGGAASYVVDDE